VTLAAAQETFPARADRLKNSHSCPAVDPPEVEGSAKNTGKTRPPFSEKRHASALRLRELQLNLADCMAFFGMSALSLP